MCDLFGEKSSVGGRRVGWCVCMYVQIAPLLSWTALSRSGDSPISDVTVGKKRVGEKGLECSDAVK